MYAFTDLWIYGRTDLRTYGCTDSRIVRVCPHMSMRSQATHLDILLILHLFSAFLTFCRVFSSLTMLTAFASSKFFAFHTFSTICTSMTFFALVLHIGYILHNPRMPYIIFIRATFRIVYILHVLCILWIQHIG